MANQDERKRITPVDEVQLLRYAACDYRLARGHLAVYAVILEHCDDKWHAYPGPKLIAKKARLALTNVKASILKLETLKYIGVNRPGLRKKNTYDVLDPPRVPSLKIAKLIAKTQAEIFGTGHTNKPSSTGHADKSSSGNGFQHS
jgi:hypothetical protein